MKSTLYFIFLGIVMAFSSCEKENEAKLVGKWRLIENFQGYVNGGNFKWNVVEQKYSHSLTFTANGKYVEEEYKNPDLCVGNYQFLSDNTLLISSSCQTVTVKSTVSDLSSKTLIIDHQGREGVIRYKYTLEK